jgi:hypothetical protein
MQRITSNRGGTDGRRHGFAVALVVIVLAVLNIAVIGTITASGDDAQLGAMRLETVRAFYAAESGAVTCVKLSSQSMTMPAAGSQQSLGSATIEFTQVPASGQPGTIVVIGRSGFGERRVRITLAAP